MSVGKAIAVVFKVLDSLEEEDKAVFADMAIAAMRSRRSLPLRSASAAGQRRKERMLAARSMGTHTEEQWAALIEKYGGCVRCGASGVMLTRDHIVPVLLGGSDGIDNIQPLCQRCNSLKGVEIADWRGGAR